MSTRTPSGGGVWRACGQSANQCVCVSGWEEPHKARHVCVSEVRRGICESVAGVAWRVRGERGHMGRQRGWWVWWPRRSLTLTHQRGWHHSGRVCVVPPLTHTADRAGQRTQWWWLVGKAHSGGGSHTTHTATTTTCPSPRVCVCESGVDSTSTASEWTKWPHTPQHPRCHHHIHHHQQQQQEEEWCGVGHKEWVDV